METLQPLLGLINTLSESQIYHITQILAEEWRTNPWLLERDVPPWFSFQEDPHGAVIILVNAKKYPGSWFTARDICNDFWFALQRLIFCDYQRRVRPEIIYQRDAYGDNTTQVKFIGGECYTWRLSQTLLRQQDFLILDLRQIVATFIHFIPDTNRHDFVET